MSEITEQLAKRGEKIFRELAEEVDVQQVAYLLENEEAIKNAVLQIISTDEIEKRSIFRVQIDYNQTVEEMVKAEKYYFVDPNITSRNFPVVKQGNGKVNIHIIHFGHVYFGRRVSVSSEEVIRELDKMGLRPAEPPELLALGAQYVHSRNVQREFPIVALGYIWQNPRGNRYVLCLWSHVGKPILVLASLKHGWHSDYRFAAVRK